MQKKRLLIFQWSPISNQGKTFNRTSNTGEWYVLSRVSSQSSLRIIFEKSKISFSQWDRLYTHTHTHTHTILLIAHKICWNKVLHWIRFISQPLPWGCSWPFVPSNRLPDPCLRLFLDLGKEQPFLTSPSPYNYTLPRTWQFGLPVSPMQLIIFPKFSPFPNPAGTHTQTHTQYPSSPSSFSSPMNGSHPIGTLGRTCYDPRT